MKFLSIQVSLWFFFLKDVSELFPSIVLRTMPLQGRDLIFAPFGFDDILQHVILVNLACYILMK